MSTNSIQAGHLLAFIERIERLEEDKKTVADEIKDVYAEAKGTGYDVKIIRKVVSIRKQDQDQRREEEEILQLYLDAISNFDHTPLGQAAVDRDLGSKVRKIATDAFGERRELTDEEKAKGYSVGFKGKDGHAIAMKFGTGA